VTTSELSRADEVLVTNSVMGVLPVREVAGELSVDAPGPLARSIRQAYAELLRRETGHPNRQAP
jgi:branched-subunit amino acid aminotransferase/4-amino-4-deoxychorismate lyase